MDKNDCKFNIEWDYLGWNDTELGSALYSQRDWNQTLMTKINQISANVHQSALRGGANKIIIPKKLYPLFETFEYFWNGQLSGRYKVIVDDQLTFKFGIKYNFNTDNVIYVFREVEGIVLIPKFQSNPDGIDEVSFRFPENNDEIIEHKKCLNGSITILNYE